jgi:Zn-dependent M28 family amino/carboxypeptidase
VGILETAIQLSNYSVPNAVRFGFWAAEEEGLLGSTYYVENLSNASLSKIRLYLNFDMIASPNYIYAIYDGDGSSFNQTGPAGSAEIEHFFEDYFVANSLNFTATAFDGRSDYQAFIDNGIPAGGLFTGAEENKTEEEVAMFGGVAGIATDPNYHGAGDNVSNLNMTAFTVNAKGIAHAIAVYGQSYDSLPPKETGEEAARKRSLRRSLMAYRAGRRYRGANTRTVVGRRSGKAVERDNTRARVKKIALL